MDAVPQREESQTLTLLAARLDAALGRQTRAACDAFLPECELQSENEHLASSVRLYGQHFGMRVHYKRDLCLIINELDAARSVAAELDAMRQSGLFKVEHKSEGT